MGYIEKNLLDQEVILFRTKKHWILFMIPVILTAAAAFFVFNRNPFVVKISFLPAIAAAIAWANAFLEYYTSDFAVTNKRILMKEGFFFRHTNDTRLTTISSVSVNQSLLGQFFNFGTVVINSFGGGTDPFTEIDAPFNFQKCLQETLNKP